jgi:acyl-[acyl-carrier-protein]-phospholipid O-acyltransferase/long-chain-fatty-acid--[acyl-carrier-protein] ligase
MIAGILLVLAGIILTWVTLRAFLEQLLSIALILPYKITMYGPGIEQMPYRGPVIMIANHAAYLDPFLIGKVVTRRIIPMMTSVFYDLPVIYWLMSKVVKAIRVEAATFRREAPELNDAIEALKRGESLLIFPEARLRKKEDQLLFPFGQGIWHILNQLPETPIVPIWVEGAWGSYASYYKGDPFANKSMDFLREIKIVAGEARVIPKELLAEHRLTRKYLQEVVLENRTIIGL